MVLPPLAFASLLFRDLYIGAAAGIVAVIIVVEAAWVVTVARRPEQRLQLVSERGDQGRGSKVVLYPGDESVSRARLVKKVGGKIDLESGVSFQSVTPGSIGGRGRTTPIELRFRTEYAGEYSSQRVAVRVSGPLGLFSSETSIPFAQEYVVYPRTLQVAMATLKLLGRGELGETPIDMPGVGTEFYEMRQYLPSDDYRDVNWKATARRGEMVVVEHMREVGGGYLLVLDTRARGFSDTDRLASTFLSLANTLASSGVNFSVLVHDGTKVMSSAGDSPRRALETALRAALACTWLEVGPEILELVPLKSPEGRGRDTDDRASVLSLLSSLGNDQETGMSESFSPWSAALKQAGDWSTRNVVWVSGLLGEVAPLIELAWQARHYHDLDFVVADPCFLGWKGETLGPKVPTRGDKVRRAFSAAGVPIYYGDPLVVVQRIISA